MTPADWFALHGSPATLSPQRSQPLSSADERECANALVRWLAAMELTQGESVLVMSAVLGRIIGQRIHEDLAAGATGAQACFDSITLNIEQDLERRRRQPK